MKPVGYLDFASSAFAWSRLNSYCGSFASSFATSEGGSIKVGHEAEAEALGDDELEQEQIVKQKRG